MCSELGTIVVAKLMYEPTVNMMLMLWQLQNGEIA